MILCIADSPNHPNAPSELSELPIAFISQWIQNMALAAGALDWLPRPYAPFALNAEERQAVDYIESELAGYGFLDGLDPHRTHRAAKIAYYALRAVQEQEQCDRAIAEDAAETRKLRRFVARLQAQGKTEAQICAAIAERQRAAAECRPKAVSATAGRGN